MNVFDHGAADKFSMARVLFAAWVMGGDTVKITQCTVFFAAAKPDNTTPLIASRHRVHAILQALAEASAKSQSNLGFQYDLVFATVLQF
jgi:hypothetical protein